MVGKSENSVQQIRSVNEYGDGVSWFRGSIIGKGGFGCVYLANLKNPKSKYSFFPALMAVKSAEVSISGSIQKEREVLSNVHGFPDIIKCFGEETTMGHNGAMVYNLLLEYGSGGTLTGRIKKYNGGDGLSKFEVKVIARSILRGLCHIHGIGYVHYDLKPDTNQ
ncbi:serine/threonine-protein kinase bck1/slk1/ssp31 [Phtheirospermum japonicum]|uniref:Serine/threonine-protein kinase bck1/slk1/ssp31 n=1 Tax=Phtheirospermum japonicum TaxID=374723 RepID=A0A830AZQ0_9LAMI|nr:serine/threonine-protein kinase bck1/slk1/ssp31 [Phtheirospermum japonicum]